MTDATGLVPAVAAATGLEPGAAERATGVVLAALKMSSPPDLLGPIEAAVPDLNTIVARSATGPTARTGEMLMFVSELASERGAGMLAKQLGRVGLSPEQTAAAVRAILAHVRSRQGDAAVDALLARLPGFAQLAG